PGIDDDRPAKAFGLHLFEIVGDRSLGDIAIEPPPISAQAGLARRVGPSRFKPGFRVRPGRVEPQQERQGQRWQARIDWQKEFAIDLQCFVTLALSAPRSEVFFLY